MRARLTILAAAAGVLAVMSASSGQSGGGFDLTWYTIDGGGTMNGSGGTFILSGTIGQPDAQVAPLMAGGAFEISGGFWTAANVCYCPGDMNGDGRKDGLDIQRFVHCVILGGSCACADVDVMNGVTVADAAAFVNKLLSSTSCP